MSLNYISHVINFISVLGPGWLNELGIMATSFNGGGSRSTGREPPTMGKQLVNFITCGCESSAPSFCNIQNRERTHAVLVIGLYELLDNPTT
jgi:hypothetical protein